MVRALQAEALDGRQSGDDNVGLVVVARPVVGVQFEPGGTRTAEQALRPRQAELLAHAHVVGAAVGCACRGWVWQTQYSVRNSWGKKRVRNRRGC